ncbi:GNAT family N-acetyltransferase [Sinisalibacter aestuarii]|uniref:N-acetyltransferase n=1 Tax=Sinisalibacter aestuarii TaxID=2949426 RepID=A0ABQ5LVQ8_9RHOB|nr:GNAT family N-acetyltransferase [Sinisalibacter aestuarii]GKY88974.1 N-acetyltransferase [Sinisalibacter aestuarii]
MIRTERLLLRPVEERDLDDLFAVYSNPQAMRYWSRPPHESREVTQARMQGLRASLAETGSEFVIDRGGRVIGRAGVWRIAEIGYILHPDFWRRGIMHEALSALIPHAFRQLEQIDALTAEIDPRNIASARLLAKLGFHETHRAANTIEVGGEWCDSSYWRLARPALTPPG